MPLGGAFELLADEGKGPASAARHGGTSTRNSLRQKLSVHSPMRSGQSLVTRARADRGPDPLPVGFLGSAWLTRRSVGDGLGLLLFIGSVYGLARCRVLDGFTHFWFDASSIGAYAALYSRATSGKTPGLFGLSVGFLRSR